MDGGMVFTREEKWKEMKLGLLFAANDCVQLQDKRGIINQSLYVCHLGGHTEFLDKWANYTQHYKHKIFIGDGAKWLSSWSASSATEAGPWKRCSTPVMR